MKYFKTNQIKVEFSLNKCLETSSFDAKTHMFNTHCKDNKTTVRILLWWHKKCLKKYNATPKTESNVEGIQNHLSPFIPIVNKPGDLLKELNGWESNLVLKA